MLLAASGHSKYGYLVYTRIISWNCRAKHLGVCTETMLCTLKHTYVYENLLAGVEGGGAYLPVGGHFNAVKPLDYCCCYCGFLWRISKESGNTLPLKLLYNNNIWTPDSTLDTPSLFAGIPSVYFQQERLAIFFFFFCELLNNHWCSCFCWCCNPSLTYLLLWAFTEWRLDKYCRTPDCSTGCYPLHVIMNILV